jgi:hypothetical protein
VILGFADFGLFRVYNSDIWSDFPLVYVVSQSRVLVPLSFEGLPLLLKTNIFRLLKLEVAGTN